MAKLTIRDAFPADLNGEYEIALDDGFTKHEYHLMKKEVGIVLADISPGAPLDANVTTAFGLVVLDRAGKANLIPAFMQTTDAQTSWDFSQEEAEMAAEDAARPPVRQPGSSPTSDATAPSEPSGLNTNGASGSHPETIPLVTGSPV